MHLATDCTPLMKVACHNWRSLPEENAKITLKSETMSGLSLRAVTIPSYFCFSDLPTLKISDSAGSIKNSYCKIK